MPHKLRQLGIVSRASATKKLTLFISLPNSDTPLFYALPYPVAHRRYFDLRRFAFKSLILIPLITLLLATTLTAKPEINIFAAPQTIASPGLTITIDNTDPFSFSLDAGMLHYATQTLSLNTTSAGGYTINMETGGFHFTPAGQIQAQTILTSDLVNTDPAYANDPTKRIPSLTTDTPYNNIQNAYGYNFTNGNLTVTNATIFKPAPQIIDDNGTLKSQTIKLAETDHKNLTDDTYSLAIAVNANTSIPAGTYQNTLLIAVTANIADYTVYFCDNKDDQNPCDNPTSQLISEGIPEQLDPNPYTRPGYAFKGWNTKPDGTGTTYPANYETSPGHEIEDENGIQATSGGSVNLYAVWQAEEYTVIYDGNTATSGTMPNQTILRDTPTNLTKNQYTKTGYYFAGWATNPDGNVLYTDEQQVENLAPTNGTITLYAKWTTSQYNVVYDGNHATSGTTAPQTVGYNEQLPLNANGFNRTGSRFLGWATTSWANTPKYTNSQTLTPAQVNELVAGLGHGDTVTLYAVWETPLSIAYADAGKTKVAVGSDSYYTMQDMDPSICYSTNVIGDASITPVVDTRDNKIYLVTKLADDRCWMVQNLDHNIDANRTYTPADTDIPANWKPDKSTYATNDTTWDNTDIGNNTQQSYDPGNKIWDGTLDPNRETWLDNMAQGTNVHYSIGNFYGFNSAVAMNDTSAYTTDGQDLNQSICPKGWMLPKDGAITTSGSFQYLMDQYNWSNNSMINPYMWQSPLYFPLSAYWPFVNGQKQIGYRGYFQTSVVNSPSNNYIMWLEYSGMTSSPAAHHSKFFGFSVRCLARNNYTVKFNSNGGTGTMPDQSMEYGAYTNLANYSFTPPANKTFIGWNTNANGTGTSYPNSASVVNLAGTDTSITLYAQYANAFESAYEQAGKTKHNGYYKLQDMNSEICAQVGIVGAESEATLIDVRDDKTYVVRKLADGKCWMVQNLALGGDTAMNLTPENTDITKDFTLEGHDASWGGSNSAAGTNINRMYSNGTAWMDGNTKMTSGTPPSATQYMGNYYNWYTATAGTGTYASAANTIASESICPKGWRLPTGGAINATTGNGEFQALYNVYGSNYTNFNTAFPLTLAGYFGGTTSVNSVGSYQYLWSATVYSSTSYVYNLNRTATSLTPNGSSYKFWGLSMRCVARDTYTINFDVNGGSGTMASQMAYIGQATRLNASTFTAPANRSFIGWTTNADGSGDFYANGAGVTNLASAGGSVTLYAKYAYTLDNAYFDAGKTKHNGYYKLQDISSDICSAVNTSGLESQATLIDVRDNKTYVVRKLADGKCWMVQNLAIGGDTAMNLTPETTDITNDFTLEGHNTNWGGANSAAGTNINRMYSNGTAWMDGNTKMNSGTPPSATQYMGNYYNWYTATAGTGTYESANDVIASESICPKGWRLPTGGTVNTTTGNGEYGTLYTAYNNFATFDAAFLTTRVGLWSGTAVSNLGTYYGSWSATAQRSGSAYNYAYTLTATASSINSVNSTFRYYGNSMRCVARDTYTIEFNNNGGSGSMPSQMGYVGQAVKLNANTFTAPAGQVFIGWNTDPSGSGTAYADEGLATNLTTTGQTTTLYAQWATPYTITYDLDGGTNDPANPSIYHSKSETFTLSAPTKAGWAFKGWTGSNGTTPQKTVEIPKGTTGDLYYTANWGPIYYLVNNGSAQVEFMGASSCSVGGTICQYQENTWGGNTIRYIYTTNIDVTGYSTLYYEVDFSPSSGSNGLQSSELLVSSSNYFNSGIEARTSVKSNSASYTPGTIDVSALQGVKTIGFSMNANTNFGRTTKLGIINLWLE